MVKNNASVYMGLLMLLFSAVIFCQSLQLDYYTDTGPGPGFFPLWLSGGLGIFSLSYIVSSFKEKIAFSEILPTGSGLWNVVTLVGSLVFFLLTVEYLGFLLACTIMLFFILRRLFTWYSGLMISIAISLCLFVVFHIFLGVPLPVNALGW
ncbi:tripartite tricarboxylate transporter TctB family protein [Paenibacillus naphthalenovorans]|uniref:tripartite tricarboxylate transporter TctB family protein n=1 Tax=Paenibacillus naphthalenovorans TaxID=162209 RepID=UPI0010B2FC2E|nr:tripartite tricarboxylate transporter TctB family protein [Paenibacillus naphthalenovorans]GCL72983.1 tripartite tricarboxylate transporter TctB family protein [Paenibacillus naphthalenovorans]